MTETTTKRSCLNLMIKKIVCIGVSVLCLVYLTGCGNSTSSIYNGVKSQAEQELNSTKNSVAKSVKISLGETLYNFAITTKSFAPMVIAGSLAIGIILLLIVRKERNLRKKIIGFFILGIPILMFIISYGLAILVTTYNF